MTPWVAYGQTNIDRNTSINNPGTNAAGVTGEVSLPYTVPCDHVLTLTGWGVEGAFGMTALFPWLGSSPATNGKALPTALGNGFTNSVEGAWVLSSGTIVNAYLTYLGTSTGAVQGWWIQGVLSTV